jgi:hypothetical protein
LPIAEQKDHMLEWIELELLLHQYRKAVDGLWCGSRSKRTSFSRMSVGPGRTKIRPTSTKLECFASSSLSREHQRKKL